MGEEPWTELTLGTVWDIMFDLLERAYDVGYIVAKIVAAVAARSHKTMVTLSRWPLET